MPLTVVWSPTYEVDLEDHVYPTEKYRLARERLLTEGVVSEAHLVEAEPVGDEVIGGIHTLRYLRKLRREGLSPGELTRLELPFSEDLHRAMRFCCGGTLMACRRALESPAGSPGRPGIAVHLGGGHHHGFPDHGEGFCLLNDVAVAAAELLRTRLVERVAVVDLDVHHGNGTAVALAGLEGAFTFSMHQHDTYPRDKPPSDRDVGLEDGVGDGRYLEALAEHLPQVMEAARPDLVIYVAGADPYRDDRLGALELTLDGLRARDRMVFEAAREVGAAVAVVLAGGYARETSDTVEIHVGTCREAARAMEEAAPGRS